MHQIFNKVSKIDLFSYYLFVLFICLIIFNPTFSSRGESLLNCFALSAVEDDPNKSEFAWIITTTLKVYPLISFRRIKNISRDNLVRSALRQNLPASAGTFSCSRCYTCSFLSSTTSISGPKSINFVIRHNFTCTSSNIIYCISCSECCKLYIGETGRRLSDRFSEHLRSVRNNDVDKPVARHFNTAITIQFPI